MPIFRGRLHWPHFHIDNTRNLRLLFGIRLLRNFLQKISFFFLPIYLYQLGEKLDFLVELSLTPLQAGILSVSLFFLISRTAAFFLAIPLSRFNSAMGYKKSLVLSHLTYAAMFVAFMLSMKWISLIWIASFLHGVQINTTWNTFHTLLSILTKRKHIGEDLGLLQIFIQIIAAVSPALGGIIAMKFGFGSLFALGAVFSLVGIWLSVKMSVQEFVSRPSWGEFFQWLREPSFFRLSASFAGRYVNDAVIVVWPLYVFLILSSIDKVGFLYSFSLLAAMALSFFVGYYIDHHKSKKPFFVSGGILSALWLVRTQVFTPLSIGLIDGIERLVSNVHTLFFDAGFMNRGKGKFAFHYFVYREMVLSATGIIFWLVVAAIFLTNGDWPVLFISAAVAVLLTLLFKEKKN